jgi:hypothetical protein
MRQRVLIVAALILVLTLHPWTWPAHGTSGLLVPTLVYAIVVVIVCVCAIRLGDLPSPFHRLPARGPRRPKLRVAPQKRQPERTAEDVTRAAEQLLRQPRRRP